ncbi:unnamed protein product [Clavelina lepadiformis]|uniref:Cadherin domain-containing protein n=1 Tax=Clavelina lepadiformis TaxID=159417 RepID=A0ABP0F464_CLALP
MKPRLINCVQVALLVLALDVAIPPMTSALPSPKVEIPFFEEQPKGTEIHNLKNDVSISVRPSVFFKLTGQYMTSSGGPIMKEWVALNEETGVITVNQRVDRETDCDADSLESCIIHVTVFQKPQKYFKTINLELEVVDVNDNSPVFPVPVISVNISEGSPVNTRKSLDKFLATDADIGDNSNIYYTLSRNNYFNIHSFKDPTDGTPRLDLVVNDELDYETAKVYELTLTATDRGTPAARLSRIKIRVGITDANDNEPVFAKQTYRLDLRENMEPGSVITTVHATDADSGVRGEVRYFVPVSGNTRAARNLVTVDPVTGNIMLKEPLDREKHDNLQITIGARDRMARNSRKGKTILDIHVKDENDNAPVIHVNIIVEANDTTAFVPESARVGTYVAQITAEDADAGVNGEVTMDISTSLLSPPTDETAVGNDDTIAADFSSENAVSQYFALDQEKGLIATDKLLDREKYPGFLVSILACDNGVEPMCSEKNLTIKVLDENDHSPQFSKTTKLIQLREDTEVGTHVTVVKASDRDAIYQPAFRLSKDLRTVEKSRNGEVHFKLFGGGRCFHIDEETGLIRLVGALDYEKKKAWKLKIMAKDEGEPSKSANMTINVKVTDVNDNRPVFSNPAINNSTVPATIQSDEIITRIKAIDYDEGSHSEVHYSITTEDEGIIPPRKFILDRFKGDLRLNMSNPHLKDMIGTHTIMIKAQDLGSPSQSSFTTLRIEVYDVPLALLPTSIKQYDGLEDGKNDYTIILIASLAAATLLLVLVLTAVVVKCKRENKEIRTYNCRNAESKKGWQLSESHATLPGDVIVTPSNHLMASRDSNLNTVEWNKNLGIRNNYSPSPVVLSNTGSLSNVSQRTFERKMTSFSKDPRKDKQPVTSQVDGDSGRGDSDHDTGSCEDKESLRHDKARQQQADQGQHNYSDVVVLDAPNEDSMGPLCTHLCRQYGHSDACWMHVLDEQTPQQQHYLPCDVHQRPNTPRGYSSYLLNSQSCLETICETQPLHSVLGSEDPTQDEYDQNIDSSYQDSSATSHVALLNRYDADCYPQVSTMVSSASYNQLHCQSPASSDRMTPVPAPRLTPAEAGSRNNLLTDKRHSVSDMFHDGVGITSNPATPSSYYPSSASNPTTPSHYGAYGLRSESPTNASKRRSTTSLHGELLHRRFLAAAQGAPKSNPSPLSHHYGEVSMEETQQIIDDIDQLIDN